MIASDIRGLPGSSWRVSFSCGLLLLAPLMGCGTNGGPDVVVSPSYQATHPMTPVGGNNLSVSVAVVDARTVKATMRADGREVIAQGDKGKIFLTKSAPLAIEESLSAALKAAGFNVVPGSPVVVEADLVDLPVQAYQFTHWNLPSERASTLDALGALVPGPVRETHAKVAMNVIIRKHDTRLGFSHVVGSEAVNKSGDSAIVSQTLNQAINSAVDDAVAKAAPDIDIVTRTPVTAKEIGGREDEIFRQQKAMKDLTDMLARREERLGEDRKAVEEMRTQLQEDQRQASETLATDRAELAKQGAQLAQDQTAVKAKLVELNQKPKETPGIREEVAAAEKRQKEVEAQAKQVEKATGELDVRRQAIADREKNLASYSAKLDEQTAQNKSLAGELNARQRDLDDREKALTNWKADLENRVAAKPPDAIVQKRRPLILITEPAASRTETTLPLVTISGIAVDDRQVSTLSATVNGQVIPNVAVASEAGGRGVGIRAVPVISETPATQPGDPGLSSRPFSFPVALKQGSNEIVIEAVDEDNLRTTQKLTVSYDRGEGRIYIIAIGINDYQNRSTIPPLRFAVADAREVAGTFEQLLGTGDTQVRQMLDTQATRANLVKQLFQQLPTEVRPQDTVVIFFSGHGAPDAATDAQGNVETFLLPIDADPARLFTTAIRMNDVATILRRLRSDRIVFLADTCYSGAAGVGVSGARTVSLPGVAMKGGVGIKAVPDRPRGKGCAVITASSGIQVAQEKTDVQHGVFTHHLLQGLKGAADSNHDGHVTVDELFEYVRDQVSKSTDGKQTPQISRDATAGEIVLSNVAK